MQKNTYEKVRQVAKSRKFLDDEGVGRELDQGKASDECQVIARIQQEARFPELKDLSKVRY